MTENSIIVGAVLNRRPVQFSENRRDVVSFHALIFVTVLAAAFCAACRRLIWVLGKPARRQVQQFSFDTISETAMLFAVLRVRYELTLFKDREKKKQDLTTYETC